MWGRNPPIPIKFRVRSAWEVAWRGAAIVERLREREQQIAKDGDFVELKTQVRNNNGSQSRNFPTSEYKFVAKCDL
jgi:hypothetical protein